MIGQPKNCASKYSHKISFLFLGSGAGGSENNFSLLAIYTMSMNFLTVHFSVDSHPG